MDGRKYGLNLKYSFENKLLDTAGAIKLAEPMLKDYFFTLYGTLYSLFDFQDMLSTLERKNTLGLCLSIRITIIRQVIRQ